MEDQHSCNTGNKHKRLKRFILILLCLIFLLFLPACWIHGVIDRMGELPDPASFNGLENFSDGTFKNQEPNVVIVSKAVKKKGFLKFLFHSDNTPSFPLPMAKDRFTDVKQDLAVCWLGHSSVIFELGGNCRFITDPVFGNAAPVSFAARRYGPPPFPREELPQLDFILISHDHYDHLEYDTIRYFRDSGVHFVTGLGVGARLRGWGIAPERIHELNWHESVTLGTAKITAVPSRHFSGRTLKDRYKTLWSCWVIENNGRRVFFGGDSAYGKHFKAIGEKYGPFDLACMEIDAWNERWKHNHMFPHEFPVAAAELKAKIGMPIHWAVFDLAGHPWKESITMVADEARKAGLPLFTPVMGAIAVPGVTETPQWWADLPEK